MPLLAVGPEWIGAVGTALKGPGRISVAARDWGAVLGQRMQSACGRMAFIDCLADTFLLQPSQ
jgi:hypothetical protein